MGRRPSSQFLAKLWPYESERGLPAVQTMAAWHGWECPQYPGVGLGLHIDALKSWMPGLLPPFSLAHVSTRLPACYLIACVEPKTSCPFSCTFDVKKQEAFQLQVAGSSPVPSQLPDLSASLFPNHPSKLPITVGLVWEFEPLVFHNRGPSLQNHQPKPRLWGPPWQNLERGV